MNAAERVLVIDNGAYSLKAGFAGQHADPLYAFDICSPKLMIT
jgi:actin-related protein